jgi:transcriptional regulator with XRE-family HTH domain
VGVSKEVGVSERALLLGSAVRYTRGARHLSQREAAAEIGVSRRTLVNIEAGRHYPIPRYRRAIEAWLEKRGAD